MHFGLIGLKAPVSVFRQAFSEAWPHLEIVAEATDFSSASDLWNWKADHERFVSAAAWNRDKPGMEVYVFWQDHDWAVLADFSYLLAADENGLQKLSERHGTIVSFVVETTGGCAFFSCYESGRLRRRIESIDGEVTYSGKPITEEDGIQTGSFYMEETEKLMRSLGFSSLEELPITSSALAISAIDRTDYSPTSENTARHSTSNPPDLKPWWRFW